MNSEIWMVFHTNAIIIGAVKEEMLVGLKILELQKEDT